MKNVHSGVAAPPTRSWRIALALLMSSALLLLSVAPAEAQTETSTATVVRETPKAVDGLSGNPTARTPASLQDGFTIRNGIRVEMIGAHASSREATSVGAVYRNAVTATDLVAQQTVDGARHLLVLNGNDAPNEFRFRIHAQQPVELIETSEGGVRIIDERSDDDLAYVAPPWAEDADGIAVPTSFRVEGRTLIQTVDHSATNAYPVVADPYYGCGWVTCTLYFNRSETYYIQLGLGGTACAALSGIAASACSVAAISYTAVASYAYDRGGCLKVKHTVGWPGVGTIWPDTHYGSRCY